MLKSLFGVGIDAVVGNRSVEKCLSDHAIGAPVDVLAIGKAAASMLEGACNSGVDIEAALMVTKAGHVTRSAFDPRFEIIEAAHPVPDQSSMEAGRRVLDWVSARKEGSTLLFLVSGGASSLVEVLVPDAAVDRLLTLNQSAMAQGLTISQINTQRTDISAIKGGKLLSHFPGKRVITLYISYVEDDSIATVGSGIGASPPAPNFEFELHLIASNTIARNSIVRAAKDQGLNVIQNAELLFDDVSKLAPMLAQRVIAGPRGLNVWGGESTVHLPTGPGLGGRNQHLGLLFAKEIAGQTGITGLFAGTDGTDGPTDFAGALVDGTTFNALHGAEEALKAADSGTYLQRAGAIFETGPTGTNVMDVALVLKQ